MNKVIGNIILFLALLLVALFLIVVSGVVLDSCTQSITRSEIIPDGWHILTNSHGYYAVSDDPCSNCQGGFDIVTYSDSNNDLIRTREKAIERAWQLYNRNKDREERNKMVHDWKEQK
jgi:hypothetical protein